MGFKGDPYTWQRSNVRKRLDRMLVNLDWRLRFEEADVLHLPNFKSDHNPLLVQLEKSNRINQQRRPFRFEAAWITHQSFNKLIQDNWRNENSNWSIQMKELQGSLKEWNKATFGNVFEKKQALMRELRSTERKLSRGWSNQLLWLQK